MDWFVKAFIKASVTWLALGVTLGLAIAIYPLWVIYRPAHLHMLLLGFVAMMIYGVAYHVIPRFVGFPLHSTRAAGWHWWMSNVGLLLMVAGFVVRARSGAVVTVLLSAGGILAALGAYTFAYVLWRTLDGPKRKLARSAPRQSNRPHLPLAEPTAATGEPRRQMNG
jgi:heme/copper-type cytochrome/quinol oxidase subunit 1